MKELNQLVSKKIKSMRKSGALDEIIEDCVKQLIAKDVQENFMAILSKPKQMTFCEFINGMNYACQRCNFTSDFVARTSLLFADLEQKSIHIQVDMGPAGERLVILDKHPINDAFLVSYISNIEFLDSLAQRFGFDDFIYHLYKAQTEITDFADYCKEHP